MLDCRLDEEDIKNIFNTALLWYDEENTYYYIYPTVLEKYIIKATMNYTKPDLFKERKMECGCTPCKMCDKHILEAAELIKQKQSTEKQEEEINIAPLFGYIVNSETGEVMWTNNPNYGKSSITI